MLLDVDDVNQTKMVEVFSLINHRRFW